MIELEVRNLSVAYTMKRSQEILLALNALNFQVPTGSLVTIIGPSGCGKSTLLNAIAGLLPVSHGEILDRGKPIRGPGQDRAMVFQSPSLLPWRTVLSNVIYGLELRGVNRSKAQKTAKEYIDLVGLKGFEESYPHELSGGMQQRVNLARALAVEPDLLLLDEPLAALDPLLRESMAAELEKIWLDTKKTMLFVTHLISEAIYLADKVIILSSRPGRVKQILPVDFPRPRPLGIRRMPEFHALEDSLWSSLQQEIQ
jgi:NitT/TauT family transport system ATP-binding protein